MEPTGKPVAPEMIPTYAKASVGHPPVSEIRRSLVEPQLAELAFIARILHGQCRGLLRRRMTFMLPKF